MAKVKEKNISVNGSNYERLPIKTKVFKEGDDLVNDIYGYTKDLLQEGDMFFISEKCVACTQGRAIPMESIQPSGLAKFLSRFVTKTPAGIGLGIPETMHFAIKECGTFRILLAAAAGAIGKAIGKKGWFYIVAGPKASSIDGPTPNTLPPYNHYVVLGPKEPNKVAKAISDKIGVPAFVVDINDLGGNILGSSDPAIDNATIVKILKDNPLGQDHEQTPMGIIRKINN
ncbi:MAG: coenzyme F420-0:L-glutamate ligase [Erysipelotrichaceae bacterium]|nr:coenzyme F420-0:L-glutamate ligase [Erysipelotrichaceae bacterium]MBR4122433.1 coenzyme F420-0:L-glutamate ligase [Erysipelotrichaceae bacterium]